MTNTNNLHVALAISSIIFTVSWLPAPRLFDAACIVLILLFISIILLPDNRDLRKDPAIQLGVLFFIYIVMSIIWHRLTLPDSFPHTTSDRRFLRVLYFIAIAYAIARSRLLTAWQHLALAFVGLLVYLVISFDKTEWVLAWNGNRVDFGIHNAQHTGIVFATCTLALMFFTPRFLHWTKRKPLSVALGSASLWLSVLLFSIWGVFVSQTRAVWLGLSVALLLLPGISVFARSLRGNQLVSPKKFLSGSIAGILLLGLLATGFDVPGLVGSRLSAEKITWETLRLAAAHEEQSLTSVGVRVASWSASADWIMERPFMGWGGRASRTLIRQSDLFSDTFKKTFNHLHNSYLQVLVEIGLVGAVFIVGIMMIIGRACIKSYKNQAMPLDVFLFSWTFFLFWLVINIFESYIIYPSGTYLIAVIAGFIYSFCIGKKASLGHRQITSS